MRARPAKGAEAEALATGNGSSKPDSESSSSSAAPRRCRLLAMLPCAGCLSMLKELLLLARLTWRAAVSPLAAYNHDHCHLACSFGLWKASCPVVCSFCARNITNKLGRADMIVARITIA